MPISPVLLRPAAGCVLSLVLLFPACEGSNGSSGSASRIDAVYDERTGRLSQLAYDTTGSGRLDTWAYMDGAKLVRIEIDEDEDGRIDRWEYYAATEGSAAVRRVPERIDRATRLDGAVSRREFFEGGVLARVEEDTDGDGRTDKWETYAGGTLSALALDTSGAGRPDRRLVYRPDGSLDRIEPVTPPGREAERP